MIGTPAGTLSTRLVQRAGQEPLTADALVRRLRVHGLRLPPGHARLFVEALLADQSSDDALARALLTEFAEDIGLGARPRRLARPDGADGMLLLVYGTGGGNLEVVAWDPERGWFIGALNDIIAEKKKG